MDYPIQTPSQLTTHLKSLRKAKGLSQTQLGLLLGIGQARIADIEKNPGLISVEQLLRILHALDTRLALKPQTPQTPQAPTSQTDSPTPKGEW